MGQQHTVPRTEENYRLVFPLYKFRLPSFEIFSWHGPKHTRSGGKKREKPLSYGQRDGRSGKTTREEETERVREEPIFSNGRNP